MRVAPGNILCHELIGLEVKVKQYTDSRLVGLLGVVVDETLKSLVIEKSNGRRIRVFKVNGVFSFRLPSGEEIDVVGVDIIGRPWDRLKRNIEKCRV
ncbi:MAG: ribonuclease P protein subunit [Desulfurococcaceae archaeon]|jgi:ribonuclease P protein subunit POP4|nr:ribonuclease P protein subunit [Desulfurococcaceae archaeon]